MSGTLPDFLVERVNREAKNEGVSYKLIEDKEGLSYTPFKLERYQEVLITKENVNEKIIDEISKNFKKGFNQFVVLNTVERAQKMFKVLKEKLNEKNTENIFLLHSQFTYGDRSKKEEEVIRILKKEKKNSVILVATQVIEISLDISCDVMYTELAPADALGQRGGRINRGNKYWKKNGKQFIIKIFQPENELPYDKDVMQNTDKVLKSGVYSYLKLKDVCNQVYGRNYFEKFEENWNSQINGMPLITVNGMDGIFEKTSLFGKSPQEVVFSEEKGNSLIVRLEKQPKFEVIPWTYYQGDERKLKVENKAKVPLWWYFKDEKEHGKDNLQWFEYVIKEIGRKRRVFWICRLPYEYEYGFDVSQVGEENPEGVNPNIL